MRVLFIDGQSPDIASGKAALRAAGHDVDQVLPTEPNLREVLARPWDVVVMEWLSSPTTVELVESLTRAEGDTPACIVCSAKATRANIDAAFKAGAEDFLRKPLLAEQLLGRVGRIVSQREGLVAAAARALVKSKSATSVVTSLAAWNGFRRLAAEAVSGVTTLDVVVSDGLKGGEPWLASTMGLTLASAHLECRAVVDGDRQSLETFANAAVGTTAPSAIADLLNEIVNTAGGAFMRSALEENVELTTGIPSSVALSDLQTLLESAHDAVVCWLLHPESGARMRVCLGVRTRQNMLVTVTSLREGMVLASDLRGPEGAILLTAGTRVTSSTSERVRRLLDARRMVEVADTAA